jgi:5-methylcytosine-specific restriction endonuclease McrA
MPIPAEIRRLHYGVHWYAEIRPAALERAGYRCQRCGLVDGAVGYRTRGLFHPVPLRRRRGRDLVTIHLQVAHDNHTPGDDREENLLALCARCHFLHDREKHKHTRAARKDQARPLLMEVAHAAN